MSAASGLFYVLHVFELAGRGIYRNKTKVLGRGFAAMRALRVHVGAR